MSKNRNSSDNDNYDSTLNINNNYDDVNYEFDENELKEVEKKLESFNNLENFKEMSSDDFKNVLNDDSYYKNLISGDENNSLSNYKNDIDEKLLNYEMEENNYFVDSKENKDKKKSVSRYSKMSIMNDDYLLRDDIDLDKLNDKLKKKRDSLLSIRNLRNSSIFNLSVTDENVRNSLHSYDYYNTDKLNISLSKTDNAYDSDLITPSPSKGKGKLNDENYEINVKLSSIDEKEEEKRKKKSIDLLDEELDNLKKKYLLNDDYNNNNNELMLDEYASDSEFLKRSNLNKKISIDKNYGYDDSLNNSRRNSNNSFSLWENKINSTRKIKINNETPKKGILKQSNSLSPIKNVNENLSNRKKSVQFSHRSVAVFDEKEKISPLHLTQFTRISSDSNKSELKKKSQSNASNISKDANSINDFMSNVENSPIDKLLYKDNNNNKRISLDSVRFQTKKSIDNIESARLSPIKNELEIKDFSLSQYNDMDKLLSNEIDNINEDYMKNNLDNMPKESSNFDRVSNNETNKLVDDNLRSVEKNKEHPTKELSSKMNYMNTLSEKRISTNKNKNINNNIDYKERKSTHSIGNISSYHADINEMNNYEIKNNDKIENEQTNKENYSVLQKDEKRQTTYEEEIQKDEEINDNNSIDNSDKHRNADTSSYGKSIVETKEEESKFRNSKFKLNKNITVSNHGEFLNEEGDSSIKINSDDKKNNDSNNTNFTKEKNLNNKGDISNLKKFFKNKNKFDRKTINFIDNNTKSNTELNSKDIKSKIINRRASYNVSVRNNAQNNFNGAGSAFRDSKNKKLSNEKKDLYSQNNSKEKSLIGFKNRSSVQTSFKISNNHTSSKNEVDQEKKACKLRELSMRGNRNEKNDYMDSDLSFDINKSYNENERKNVEQEKEQNEVINKEHETENHEDEMRKSNNFIQNNDEISNKREILSKQDDDYFIMLENEKGNTQTKMYEDDIFSDQLNHEKYKIEKGEENTYEQKNYQENCEQENYEEENPEKENYEEENYEQNYEEENYEQNYEEENYEQNCEQENYEQNYEQENYEQNCEQENYEQNYEQENYGQNYEQENYEQNYEQENYEQNYEQENYEQNYEQENYEQEHYDKLNDENMYERNLNEKDNKAQPYQTNFRNRKIYHDQHRNSQQLHENVDTYHDTTNLSTNEENYKKFVYDNKNYREYELNKDEINKQREQNNLNSINIYYENASEKKSYIYEQNRDLNSYEEMNNKEDHNYNEYKRDKKSDSIELNERENFIYENKEKRKSIITENKEKNSDEDQEEIKDKEEKDENEEKEEEIGEYREKERKKIEQNNEEYENNNMCTDNIPSYLQNNKLNKILSQEENEILYGENVPSRISKNKNGIEEKEDKEMKNKRKEDNLKLKEKLNENLIKKQQTIKAITLKVIRRCRIYSLKQVNNEGKSMDNLIKLYENIRNMIYKFINKINNLNNVSVKLDDAILKYEITQLNYSKTKKAIETLKKYNLKIENKINEKKILLEKQNGVLNKKKKKIELLTKELNNLKYIYDNGSVRKQEINLIKIYKEKLEELKKIEIIKGFLIKNINKYGINFELLNFNYYNFSTLYDYKNMDFIFSKEDNTSVNNNSNNNAEDSNKEKENNITNETNKLIEQNEFNRKGNFLKDISNLLYSNEEKNDNEKRTILIKNSMLSLNEEDNLNIYDISELYKREYKSKILHRRTKRKTFLKNQISEEDLNCEWPYNITVDIIFSNVYKPKQEMDNFNISSPLKIKNMKHLIANKMHLLNSESEENKKYLSLFRPYKLLIDSFKNFKDIKISTYYKYINNENMYFHIWNKNYDKDKYIIQINNINMNTKNKKRKATNLLIKNIESYSYYCHDSYLGVEWKLQLEIVKYKLLEVINKKLQKYTCKEGKNTNANNNNNNNNINKNDISTTKPNKEALKYLIEEVEYSYFILNHILYQYKQLLKCFLYLSNTYFDYYQNIIVFKSIILSNQISSHSFWLYLYINLEESFIFASLLHGIVEIKIESVDEEDKYNEECKTINNNIMKKLQQCIFTLKSKPLDISDRINSYNIVDIIYAVFNNENYNFNSYQNNIEENLKNLKSCENFINEIIDKKIVVPIEVKNGINTFGEDQNVKIY